MSNNKRGYFEIGIYHTKIPQNLGTLWRSAYQLGASGIFTIGRRYEKQASDTCKTPRHIPLREYVNFEEFLNARPKGAQLICVETGGKNLKEFVHPEQAIYLLGAEDHGLPEEVLSYGQHIISLDFIREPSYNVAVAATLIMYDRQFSF